MRSLTCCRFFTFLVFFLPGIVHSQIIVNDKFVFDWPVGRSAGGQVVPGHGFEIVRDFGEVVSLASGNRSHAGLDFQLLLDGNTTGESVRAAADGEVECVTNADYPGYVIVLKHSYYVTIAPDFIRTIYSMYGHIKDIPANLIPGATVARGDFIGKVFDHVPARGHVAHLHFETRTFGDFTDPLATGTLCAAKGYATTTAGFTDPTTPGSPAPNNASYANHNWLNPEGIFFDIRHRREWPAKVRGIENDGVKVRSVPSIANNTPLTELPIGEVAFTVGDVVPELDASNNVIAGNYWYPIRFPPQDTTTKYIAAYRSQQISGDTTIFAREDPNWNCGLPCEECIFKERHDVLGDYLLAGQDISCNNFIPLANDWCTNGNPTACTYLKLNTCSSVCGSPVPQGNGAWIRPEASNVASSLAPGQTANVRVRVKNTGSTVWRENPANGFRFRLASQPANNVDWIGFSCGGYANSPTDSRAFLCRDVFPGEEYDFNFTVRAPSSGSTAFLSVRMVNDAQEFFGGSTTFSIALDSASCASFCAQCILGQRTDILPFYQQNGWDISCSNHDAIVDNWCSPAVDPAACQGLMQGGCSVACGTASCGEPCSDCILDARPDILPFYDMNGWDTSCSNWPAIVDNWCSAAVDPAACSDLKAGQCTGSCGTSGCGNACAECVIAARPDVRDNFGLWGWDTACSNWPAIVDEWCTNLAPGECTDVMTNSCSGICPVPPAPPVAPVADPGGPYSGVAGDPVVFDASGSFDADGSLVDFNWDFDGDGIVDLTTGSSTAVHSYPAAFSGNAVLEVMDDSGLAASAAAVVNIDPAGPVVVVGTNFDIESNVTGQFGGIASFSPNGGWAYHSQFAANGNQGLAGSFGFYAAGTAETVGQVLTQRFAAGETYTFRSYAIGGGNRAGRVPYQIGYAATDGDVSSFVALATNLIDVTGNSSWLETAGVTYTSLAGGAQIGRQIVIRFGSGADGGVSDIWFDNITVTVGGSAPPPPPPAPPALTNADMESVTSSQFGFVNGWGPNGGWAYHSQFSAGNNQGLGSRFGFYSAGTLETVGQVLFERFAANTTYTFKSFAIGGGNQTGQVPYQIGYALVDASLGSFVPLATMVIDLSGQTTWVETSGVTYTTGAQGAEIGRQIIVRFGSGADGGSSDIWFDNLTLDLQ